MSNLLKVPVNRTERPTEADFLSEWRLYPLEKRQDGSMIPPPTDVTQYAVPWHGFNYTPRVLVNGRDYFFTVGATVPMLYSSGHWLYGIGLPFNDWGSTIVVEPMPYGLRMCDGPITIRRP